MRYPNCQPAPKPMPKIPPPSMHATDLLTLQDTYRAICLPTCFILTMVVAAYFCPPGKRPSRYEWSFLNVVFSGGYAIFFFTELVIRSGAPEILTFGYQSKIGGFTPSTCADSKKIFGSSLGAKTMPRVIQSVANWMDDFLAGKQGQELGTFEPRWGKIWGRWVGVLALSVVVLVYNPSCLS